MIVQSLSVSHKRILPLQKNKQISGIELQQSDQQITGVRIACKNLAEVGASDASALQIREVGKEHASEGLQEYL